ncbi:transporter suffix domain-containing protein [Hyphomicrobium sp.]|uniref:transporter suffix domain-containing protein n=1 Tax=Hyphomicrobium sp. TaxID=82 RepID=UPI002FE0120A
MAEKESGIRKKIGLVLLRVVLLYWVAVPLVPFLDIPNKAAIISAMIIGGEALTLVVIAIQGKEYWMKIKASVARIFSSQKGRENEQP